MLTTQEQPQLLTNMELIWHKQVPLKVSILAWRFLRDRLPTKNNLANCGILPLEAWLCVTRCGHVEDVNHNVFVLPNFWCFVAIGAGMARCCGGRFSVCVRPFFAIY